MASALVCAPGPRRAGGALALMAVTAHLPSAGALGVTALKSGRWTSNLSAEELGEKSPAAQERAPLEPKSGYRRCKRTPRMFGLEHGFT
jgi:hypothetical protein